MYDKLTIQLIQYSYMIETLTERDPVERGEEVTLTRVAVTFRFNAHEHAFHAREVDVIRFEVVRNHYAIDEFRRWRRILAA